MKKVLLLSLGLAATMAANAYTEPTEYLDYSWQGMAPNGSIAVSELYGAMTIVDLTTGTEYYYEDPTYMLTYSGGLGNYVSNTGIVVGGVASACYWQNGEWHDLSVSNAELQNIANGITPDGSRICGGMMMEAMSTEAQGIMLLPCYWDATADGFGEYHLLPHPTVDLTGRTPQYVTAVAISADGKTIVGQITDYSGFTHQPIIYTEGADGEWSYSLPANDLFHPEGYALPEDPGECPDQPKAEDFMSEEEYAAYQAAFDDYYNNGGAYPLAKDFLGEEHRAAYDAAMTEWQALYEEWAPKYDAFNDAFWALVDVVPAYEFNNVYVTPNGQKYVTSGYVTVEDPNSWWPVSVYYPAVIDLASDEVTKVETGGLNWLVSDVPNDDTFFICNGLNEAVARGWIYKDGVATPVEEWLASESEEMADWIQNNLVRSIETASWDEEGNLVVDTSDELVTGICIANSDLSTMAMWAQSTWSYDYITAAYIFNLDNSGVKDVVAVGNNTITFDQDGNMVVDGDIQAVTVYDLQGRQVLNSAANGTISNNLPAGIYVVRAQTGANSSIISKIRK